MKRLIVFCEGPTEQGFCKQVLQKHLFPNHDGLVETHPVGESDGHHVYGLGPRTKYTKRRTFFVNTFNANRGVNVYFTTMFDLYALPKDFPGLNTFTKNPSDPTPYVLHLESELAADLNAPRFIPYLQLHEYETMLLADPTVFEYVIDNCGKAISKLQELINNFSSLEEIDDGPHSAPSKRIINLIPSYKGLKRQLGPELAELIGLATIRRKCPHVDYWLKQLEAIPWVTEQPSAADSEHNRSRD
jgi:hypothetical protein